MERLAAAGTLASHATSTESRVGFDFDFDLGLTLSALYGPALVECVSPGSAAAFAGLRRGDVVCSVDGEVLFSCEAVVRSLRLAARADPKVDARVHLHLAPMEEGTYADATHGGGSLELVVRRPVAGQVKAGRAPGAVAEIPEGGLTQRPPPEAPPPAVFSDEEPDASVKSGGSDVKARHAAAATELQSAWRR